MLAETSVIEREPEALRVEVNQTRTGLLAKMEALEQGIKDTWAGANEAVVDAAESAAQAIQGAARGTGEAVERALDLPRQARRHPWLVVCGGLVLGVVVCALVVGRLRAERRKRPS
ncbi:MAG TPA: hypothetical protein VFE78_31390 [Gemmataceae bacterium]|jgi:t-SNARE complex subunit (syntaxin)|nr:hypothetical protein [Gemmataceae bacterium]